MLFRSRKVKVAGKKKRREERKKNDVTTESLDVLPEDTQRSKFSQLAHVNLAGYSYSALYEYVKEWNLPIATVIYLYQLMVSQSPVSDWAATWQYCSIIFNTTEKCG